MGIVEGIGDEVIFVFGFTFLFLIFLLAWYSTSVTDHPIFRASVLVIERRRTADGNQRIINISAAETSSSSPVTPTTTTTTTTTTTLNSEPVIKNDKDTTINSQSEILPSCSAEESDTQVRNRFKPTTESRSGSEPTQLPPPPPPVVENTDSGNIRIRLVFLNDTQRLVEAKLNDQLGHFKQQHFSEELSSRRVVRLIYNGQLLQRDEETLQSYGISDNCVVHCHISTTTVPPPPPNYSQHSELDFSRLMLPLFGLILGLIWCCRMQYRQYFNAATTFALLGITGLFILSVLSVCLTARNRLRNRARVE